MSKETLEMIKELYELLKMQKDFSDILKRRIELLEEKIK
jgi:hypothetical protein